MLNFSMPVATPLPKSPFTPQHDPHHGPDMSGPHPVSPGLHISPSQSAAWNSQFGIQQISQTSFDSPIWSSFNSSDTMQDVSPHRSLERLISPTHPSDVQLETPKTKKKRAQQACSNCRRKKARCDERRPTCTQCWDTDMECVYQENKPTKETKRKEEIPDMLKDIKDRLKTVERSLNNISSEDIGAQATNAIYTNMGPFLAQFQNGCSRCERMEKILRDKRILTDADVIELVREASPESSYHHGSHGSCTPQKDVTRSPIRSAYGLSMPIRHSTPAHKLVETWSSIQIFYRNVQKPRFVLDKELSRDSLRSSAQFAVNRQGFYECRNIRSRSSFSTDTSEPYVHVDHSDLPRLVIDSPLSRHSQKDSLDLEVVERTKAQSFWTIYLKKFHILQPFLDVERIGAIIENIGLSTEHQPTFNSSNFGSSPSNIEKTQEDRRPVGMLKRKHTDEGSNPDTFAYGDHHQKPSTHAKNAIDTATVLLVLALGEISAQSVLNGNLKEERSKYIEFSLNKGAMGANTALLPAQPPIRFSTLTKSGLGAYDCLGYSNQNSDDLSLRVDSQRGVPGLSYYCCAVEILGGLVCSSEISFVHAKLLAGLYASQLVRPMEAWKSICEAALMMQPILDQFPDALDASVQNPEVLNPIRITYWTCLQLESDILAELDSFSPSGISRFESRVPETFGPVHSESSFSHVPLDMTKAMHCYSQQIQLRKILNLTHSSLYNKDKPISESNIEETAQRARFLRDQLDSWKESLKNSQELRYLHWEESDPPSSDINIARMRAKYYGAQVIIHRPLLQYILEHDLPKSEILKPGFSSGPDMCSLSFSNNGDESSAIHNEISDSASRCVEALVKSTEAFDGLREMPSRLVVTNVFGTAQAQFGNMLILAAILRHNNYQWLVEREVFDRLLARTIEFFHGLAFLSSTMETELDILLRMQKMSFNQL